MALSTAISGGALRSARGGSFGYVLPALVLIVAFFILPVLMLLLRSVLEPEPGLQNYETLLGSTTYLRIFLNTFLVAGVVTVISIVSDAWKWVPGDADWDVGVPEVSAFETVRAARAAQDRIRKEQRVGV